MPGNKYLGRARALFDQNWPVIVLIVFCIVVFAGVIIFKSESFYVFPDNIEQGYAWNQKLAEDIHSGSLPFWDANTFGGRPFAAAGQQGVFYPPNLLVAYFFGSKTGTPIIYLELLVVFHFFLASIGMYLLARALSFSKLSAIIPAVIYPYTGEVAWRSVAQTCIFFGLSLLPLAIYLLVKARQNSNKIYALAGGGVLGLTILAGHFAPIIFGAIIATILLWFIAKERNFVIRASRTFWFMGVAAIAATLVALPQLIITIPYMLQAVRWVGEANPIKPGGHILYKNFSTLYSLDPGSFMNFFDPNKYPVIDNNYLYIGLLPLIMAIGSFVIWHKSTYTNAEKEIIQSSTVLIILGSISALGYLTFFPTILFLTPIVNQIRELGRYVILISFAFSLCAGLFFEYWTHKVNLSKRYKCIASIIVGFILLDVFYIFLKKSEFGFTKVDLVEGLCLALFIILSLFKNNKLRNVALMLVVLSAIYPIHYLYMPKTNNSNYAPVYFTQAKKIADILAPQYGKCRVLVENSALPANIGDVYPIQTVWGYDATALQGYYDFINVDQSANSKQWDILNTCYVVTTNQLNLPLFYQSGNIRVYKRPNALPRVYMENSLMPVNFSVSGSEDNNYVYKIKLTTPGIVVFADNYYPGWRCRVNGKSVKILHAVVDNQATPLRAIRINVPGTYSVVFTYGAY